LRFGLVKNEETAMHLGNWQLDTAAGGRFRLDGGAMFGVVPKPLWERALPGDERNRVPLATNCVLARDGRHTVLIDTGFGAKATPREQEQMAMEPGDNLLTSLAQLGVEAAEVDTVVFSHLHFDHAGGATRYDESGELAPTFPNATYVANAREWEDAAGGAAELRGSYPPENLLPLEAAGRVRLIGDGEEIVPGLRAQHTGGHTRGHQVLLFESGGETAAYLGDICPTQAHLRQLWCMAYDTFLLDTRRRKPEILGRAADENWLVLWDHDPDMAAARLARHAKREFEVVERFETL
jgi:glyoxylase-like metal-dependent hydrolase (beta-lactamase superfamily II)